MKSYRIYTLKFTLILLATFGGDISECTGRGAAAF